MTLFLTGAAFGVIGGMGLGGGVVLIPVLTVFLGFSQHEAQALCLACFIPASVCALIFHAKAKNIAYKKALLLSLFGAGGAFAGAFLAQATDGGAMRLIFALFLLFLGGIRVFGFINKNILKKRKNTKKQ